MNYFDRFEIDKNYNIDLTQLENQYFALQAVYHPDIAQNLEEKQKFANIAIELNEGYRILKDAYSRAVYMLKLENIDIADTKANPVPTKILQQVWQKSEELEQIAIDELSLFIASLEAANKALLDDIANAFARQDYARATTATMEMKYWLNLIADAKDKRCNAVN